MPNYNLSPQGWQEAKEILLGNDTTKVSKTAAADAAGISLRELNQWVKRSREKHIEDEPWIWEIAEIYDNSLEAQAGRVEDELWDRAFNGTPTPIVVDGEEKGTVNKPDNRLLEKLVVARDKKYRDKSAIDITGKIALDVDFEVLELQWKAKLRMEGLRDVEDGELIAETRRTEIPYTNLPLIEAGIEEELPEPPELPDFFD